MMCQATAVSARLAEERYREWARANSQPVAEPRPRTVRQVLEDVRRAEEAYLNRFPLLVPESLEENPSSSLSNQRPAENAQTNKPTIAN